VRVAGSPEPARLVEVGSPAGRLRGEVRAGVARFRGIPYAAAPIGPLRFAPPVALPPWSGVCDATRPGPAAPQGRSALEPILGSDPAPQSEAKCLTLTVERPDSDAAGLPVLVWIHGGAFRTGRSGGARQSGAAVAARVGAVVVTLNYRLGPLGYLYLGGPDQGNAGLLDQAAVLRWVLGNVAAFGGDPGRITLGGHSAGALSAVALAGSPNAVGVQRLILLSPQLDDVTTPERAATQARNLCALLGVDAAGLRELPAAAVVEAAGRLGPGASPQLVAGGAGLPVDPGSLVERLPAELDVLISVTRHEARAFLLDDADAPVEGADPLTDTLFTKPTTRLCAQRAAAGHPAYRLRFDWQPPASRYGACHGADLPFLMGEPGAWARAPILRGVPDVERARVRNVLHDAVAGLVRDGVPVAPPGLSWPAWTPQRPCGLRVGDIGAEPAVIDELGR